MTMIAEKHMSVPTIAEIPAKYGYQMEGKDISPEHISAVLARQQERLASLLPLEADVKPELEKDIARLKTDLETADLNARYPTLDMSFMKMTKPVATPERFGPLALPAFAVFRLDDNVCSVLVSARWWRSELGISVSDNVGDYMRIRTDLGALTAAVEGIAQSRARGFFGKKYNYDCSIAARFSSAIPDETKAKIAEAKELFDEIIIVTEAPKWELTWAQARPPVVLADKDPLVVGRKGKRYWLVDVFDATPIERYVVEEFAVKQR